MVNPFQLRFLPSLSSRLVVLSSFGEVQLVDMAEVTQPQLSMFHVRIEVIRLIMLSYNSLKPPQVEVADTNSSVLSMDISRSNQCLAFGDSSNYLHLMSSPVDQPVFNPYARESEFASQPITYPSMDIDDPYAIYSSVPRPFLPQGQTSYLSDFWPERFRREVRIGL